jgi:hypothetical protein
LGRVSRQILLHRPVIVTAKEPLAELRLAVKHTPTEAIRWLSRAVLAPEIFDRCFTSAHL